MEDTRYVLWIVYIMIFWKIGVDLYLGHDS